MVCFLAELIFLLVTLWAIFSILLIAPWDAKKYIIHRICRIWGASIFHLCGIQLIGNSCNALPGKGPYIIMANHQSHLDPPLLLWQLPLHIRFIAKVELFSIPLFGLAMRLVGNIPIDRHNRKRAIESLERAAEKIQRGASVLIFPEGTRSSVPEGPLLPFKKGGFMLALQAKVPIIPIGIAGTGSCLPKGSWLIRPGKVSYCIGDPIVTEELTIKDRDVLMKRVYESIQNLKSKAQKAIFRGKEK